MGAATPASAAPTCGPVDFTTWEMVIERDLTGDDGAGNWAANPVVARLPADSGPTILFQSFQEGHGDVQGVDGRTGDRTLHVRDVHQSFLGLAVAQDRAGGEGWLGISDLTDSDTEVWLSVLDLTTLSWTSSAYVSPFLCAAAYDVDHDGLPEFITDDAIIDVSAAIRTTFSTDPWGAYALPVALRDDGAIQVVNSAGIWDAAGTALGRWVQDSSSPAKKIFLPGVAAVDGVPMIFAADRYGLLSASTDGQIGWHNPAYEQGQDTFSGDAIAIGDATGDGMVDICSEVGDALVLMSADGNIEWQQPRGQQLAGGCSMADLDADGLHEVIDWGSAGLVIHDGRTGQPLSARGDIGTWMWMNPPVIADVDGDGSAEIVVSGQPAGNSAAQGWNSHLYVVGAARGRWARTRPVWNQMPYDITSITDDGRILSFPFPAWQTYNAFRAQPAHDGDHPDLVVEATDACVNTCAAGGAVRVSAQVSNLGSKAAPAGAIVRLFTWTEAGGLREVASTVVADPVPSLQKAQGVVLDVPWEDWGEQRVLQVDGVLSDECDRVNDRMETNIPDPCSG